MRVTRSLITLCDCPASMSKSTPMRPADAQRLMKVAKPASDPQVNEPAAPPVDRMYFTPACVSSGTLADAIAAPCTPPQFSLPHSPVAKASVMALPPAPVRSVASAVGEPPTLVVMTLVFQFMLMLVSL